MAKKTSSRSRAHGAKIRAKHRCLAKGGAQAECEKRGDKAARAYNKKHGRKKGGKKCGCPKGTRSLTLKGGRKVCGKTRPRKKC